LGTCCKSRTDDIFPSKTNSELGKQLYGKIMITKITKKYDKKDVTVGKGECYSENFVRNLGGENI